MSEYDSESLLPNKDFHHPFKDVSRKNLLFLFFILQLPDGGILSLYDDEIYYVGIIDILITFNSLKKIEFVTKALYNCSCDMSIVPPEKYKNRFVKYIASIFYEHDKKS